MPRLFIALGLPTALKREVSLLSLGLPGGRPVPTDQLHLTLRYIGDVDEDQVEDVHEGLNSMEHPPLSLTPRGVGCFPRRKEPRMVWLGVEPNPALLHLYSSLDNALRRVGIPPEGRKFHPHVTVCRLGDTPVGRVANWLEEHALFQAPSFRVEALELYSSELHPSGARHELLASHALTGEPEQEPSP